MFLSEKVVRLLNEKFGGMAIDRRVDGVNISHSGGKLNGFICGNIKPELERKTVKSWWRKKTEERIVYNFFGIKSLFWPGFTTSLMIKSGENGYGIYHELRFFGFYRLTEKGIKPKWENIIPEPIKEFLGGMETFLAVKKIQWGKDVVVVLPEEIEEIEHNGCVLLLD